MDTREILTDAAKRPVQASRVVIKDIDPDVANVMPGDSHNSITWLLWHAGRQMDVQLADLTGAEQEWESGTWAKRLDVDRTVDDFGFGDTPDDVRGLRTANIDGLADYLEACTEKLIDYVHTLDEAALSEIVDDSWDPPVTRGVRIVSIIDDAAVHVGQAAYVRGLVEDWSIGY